MPTKRKAAAATYDYYRVLAKLGKPGVFWALGLHDAGGYVPPGELIAVPAGRRPNRLRVLLEIGSVKRVKDPKAGRCMRCGCTWTKACQGGCSWANVKRTVCSNCSA